MRGLMLVWLSLLGACDKVPDQPAPPASPKVTVSTPDAAAPVIAGPKLKADHFRTQALNVLTDY